ncbi:hypothetical protein QMA04_00270 [Planococcus sp. APC 3900]|uniref:hypothetical protein n=1 Tax=Planococcus sp. APC 3900 TaxID=3035191 RepID=UPI0025B405A1|nr:hypothetical protein [Planococcus sp. APC 3900]MDN3436499.1 hypothetical protein [Planococcus sp. APC 3900]
MRQTIQLTSEQVHKKLAEKRRSITVYAVVILMEYPLTAELSMKQALDECETSITSCSEVLIGEGAVCAVLNAPAILGNAKDLDTLKAGFEKELAGVRTRAEFAYRFHTGK